mgnify:CR=1 FL=1
MNDNLNTGRHATGSRPRREHPVDAARVPDPLSATPLEEDLAPTQGNPAPAEPSADARTDVPSWLQQDEQTTGDRAQAPVEPQAPAQGQGAPRPQQAQPQHTPTPEYRQRYVRQRAPHRTQAAINDLEQDVSYPDGYTHNSNITVGGGAFSGGAKYRRGRGSMDRIQKGQYGRYLEIPKGRRSIFASRERARRRRSILSLIVVVALLVIVAVIIWRLMGATG